MNEELQLAVMFGMAWSNALTLTMLLVIYGSSDIKSSLKEENKK